MTPISTSKDGPRLHKSLMDLACQQLEQDIEKRLVADARQSAQAVSPLVLAAYREGLRDGFVQGVEAGATNPVFGGKP